MGLLFFFFPLPYIYFYISAEETLGIRTTDILQIQKVCGKIKKNMKQQFTVRERERERERVYF